MNIHLVTGSTGFPNGTATAHRIKMVGMAFLHGNNSFSVLLNTVFNNELNTSYKGVEEGINYEYLHKRVNLNKSKLVLFLFLFKGYITLFCRIAKMNRKNDIVYIYAQGGILNPITLFFCKLFGIKVIQEINEWYHRQLNRPLAVFFMEKIAIKYSDGVIAISTYIESKVKAINPKIETVLIPVLDDNSKYKIIRGEDVDEKYCFWMGQVDGFIEDVKFIIKALAVNYNEGINYKFCVAGSYSMVSKLEIETICNEHNFPIENISLLGFVSDEELLEYTNNAYFYVVPLWDDERSNARFPTKIASFLFNEKPLITAPVGDVGLLMEDEKNVLFYKTNDYIDLANKIGMLNNNQLYIELSTGAKYFAENNLHYKNYSNNLNYFIAQL